MKLGNERVASRKSRVARFARQIFFHRASPRRAISLIEVLISMFVMLFGLMGVAAIFPVGNHYVVEGEKFDLASGIAQNAFEELKARSMLRPEVWHYADPNGNLSAATATVANAPFEFDTLVMQSDTIAGDFNANTGNFNIAGPLGPGHAFVIDPLGTATALNPNPVLPNLDIFPRLTNIDGDVVNWRNPWLRNPNIPGSNFALPGERWPVRRLTVLDANGLMRTAVAETIFRLRDDLAVDQPDESDRPSIQRWDTADIDPTTGKVNNTPNIPGDDSLLRRQYKGDYSWLATIVPSTGAGLEALQPANAQYGQISCDVSIVVFRKRDDTPAAASERLINAELLPGGELVLYSNSTSTPPKDEVDAAVEGIRPGSWISLMGVNQTTGDFVMKWYRLLSLDDETIEIVLESGLGTVSGRRAMLIGPDWPAAPNPTGPPSRSPSPLPYVPNLRAGIFPGAISVVTKPMMMENSSLWKLAIGGTPRSGR